MAPLCTWHMEEDKGVSAGHLRADHLRSKKTAAEVAGHPSISFGTVNAR